jgi:signal transduction histidine kinase
VRHTMWKTLLDVLPRGNALTEEDWQRRHRLLLWVLAAHVPALAALAAWLHRPAVPTAIALAITVACVVLGHLARAHRRTASVAVTAGLVWCSTVLVGLTGGTIEAHFHFFIIIGFIALYQDWVPFLFNVLFTVVSHGVGSMWLRSLMFNHPAAQANPWLWSVVHGLAVLVACVGVMIFWRLTEDEQLQKDRLTRELAEAEVQRRQFTSDLLVNLARRNQSMLYRQLDIIGQLEESEQDPDALAELFRLDHLTTRVRRNAENLLVLSGEKPPRVWSQPVALRDVVRAAIAETEDLDRVAFEIDDRPLIDGTAVTDLTHLIAELMENAVRYSPPDAVVTVRARYDTRDRQGFLLTVEDWGIGMAPPELAAANELLADPPEIDLSVSKHLGFHVVARLAKRHHVQVSLTATPGSGVTASVALPAALFKATPAPEPALSGAPASVGHAGSGLPRRTRLERRQPGASTVEQNGDVHRAGLAPAPFPTTSRPFPTTSRLPVLDAPATEPGRSEPPIRRGATPSPAVPPSPAPSPALAAAQRPDGSWPGWWVDPPHEHSATENGPSAGATSSATARTRPVEQGTAQPAAPTLRRRVPQASLAPGLRSSAVAPDAVEPAALSRYQARRQEATRILGESDEASDGRTR